MNYTSKSVVNVRCVGCSLAHIEQLTHSPLAIATYSNRQAVLIGKFCYSNSAGSEKNHSEPGHYQSPRGSDEDVYKRNITSCDMEGRITTPSA
jgi:hypothetical protein